MRTTLDIADDVLFAAKDFARRDKKTLGQVISEWGRKALQNQTSSKEVARKDKARKNESATEQKLREMGFVTFPTRTGGGTVTNEMINRIREEEGI
jgi:hypothetical protein